MINRILSKIEHFCYRRRINIIATLYINLRCLPFRQAYKLPIIIYGKTIFQSLSGTISIKVDKVKTGMITIGRRWCRAHCRTTICLNGALECGEDIRIDGGTEIHIERNATLKIGKGSRIYEDCMIFCYERIEIGEHSSITYHSNIFDTDFHYTIDTQSHEICKHTKPIKLGTYNWIGNKTTIKKGTLTADYTIVAASYSMLCKDYTSYNVKYPILGGVPAKLIGQGKRRIFNWDNQDMIDRYFRSNQVDSFIYEGDIDSLCDEKR